MQESIKQKLSDDPAGLGRIRCPYSLMRMEMPGKIKRIAAVCYSFSNVHGRTEANCNLSFTRLGEYAGVSRSTAARAVRMLKGKKEIGFEQVTRDEAGRRLPNARYILRVPVQGGFIRIPRYLYFERYDMKDGRAPRTLTDLEARIVGLFLTNETNPRRRERGFEGSSKRIADLLGVNNGSVRKALARLLHAGLIYRPKKGKSKRTMSLYVACKDFRRKSLKEEAEEEKRRKAEAQKAKTPQQEAIAAADAKAERDRYYSRLRWQAERVADAAERRATSDPEYIRIHREKTALDIALAKAEIKESREEEEEIRRKIRSLQSQSRRVLARLGLKPEDLNPKYRCAICNDTGYRSDGTSCSCYFPPSGRKAKQAEKEPAGN